MTGFLDGKVAIVTGGSSGIGRATAQIMAREGARVVVADVQDEMGEETVGLVKQAGGDARYVRCDVASNEAVEEMVAKTVEAYGRLDCAFNNAGIEGSPKLTADYPDKSWDKVIAVDLTAVWYCMRAEIKQMLSQGGGSIVNTASLAGLVGARGLPAYIAAKHGVVGLTKSAALEYARQNIRVNAVCPGAIETPMLQRGIDRRPQMRAAFERSEPIGRLGRPEEIGEAVVWLLSDRASFVTGLPMPVDGGLYAQ